jgi:hypothetical protein
MATAGGSSHCDVAPARVRERLVSRYGDHLLRVRAEAVNLRGTGACQAG